MISTNTSKQIQVQPTPLRIDDMVVMKRTTTSSPVIDEGKSIMKDLLPKLKQKLSNEFHPSPYSVIIGRGKIALNAIGNQRLIVIASTFLEKYSQAEAKPRKTAIVSQILDVIHDACPIGAFVKFVDGCWWEVAENVAREKVGHVLRDMLHAKYRSSSKSKVARRRKLREEARSSSTNSLESIQSSSSSSSSSDNTVKSSTTPMRRSMPILKHNRINTKKMVPLKHLKSSCPSFKGTNSNKGRALSVIDMTIAKLLDDTFRDSCQSSSVGDSLEITNMPRKIHGLSKNISNNESIKKVSCYEPDLKSQQHLSDDMNTMICMSSSSSNNNKNFNIQSLSSSSDKDIFMTPIIDDNDFGMVTPAIFDS